MLQVKYQIQILKYMNNLDLNSKEFCYLLGFLWADGYISKKDNEISIGIQEEDGVEVKDIFLKAFPFNVHIYGYKNKKWKNTMLFSKHDYNFHSFLKENDYIIKSSVSADKILSKIPEHLQHYWWLGYFDGDGNIFYRQRNAKYVCPSLSFSSSFNQDWRFLEKLLKNLNIKYTLERKERELGRNSIIWFYSFKDIESLYNYMNKTGDYIGLKRKHLIFLKILDYFNSRKLKTTNHPGITFSKKSQKFKVEFQWRGHKYYFGLYEKLTDALAIFRIKKESLLKFNYE